MYRGPAYDSLNGQKHMYQFTRSLENAILCNLRNIGYIDVLQVEWATKVKSFFSKTEKLHLKILQVPHCDLYCSNYSCRIMELSGKILVKCPLDEYRIWNISY